MHLCSMQVTIYTEDKLCKIRKLENLTNFALFMGYPRFKLNCLCVTGYKEWLLLLHSIQSRNHKTKM